MTSIADTSVKIQTTSESNPSTPAWLGEIVIVSRYLQKQSVLTKINEQVHFARKRFGHYEVIDFLAVLFDEDQEIDHYRWCSHSAWGQECWQLVAQWVWNLRLELGHHLKPEPLRATEFAPALGTPQAGQASVQGYEPPVIGGTKDQLDATRETILCSLQMEPCVAQRTRSFSPRNGGSNGAAACASSTRPGSPTAAHVSNVRTVSGMARRISIRVE